MFAVQTMTNIANALRQLVQFFDPNLELDNVEDLIDSYTSAESQPDNASSIENLSVVKTARNRPEVLSTLLELCSECRCLHSSATLVATDSWEQFVRFIVPDQMLTFFTCLIELAKIRPAEPVSRRLALISGQAFFLLQAIPGAKAFDAFHPPLIQRTFELFNLVNTLLRANILKRDSQKIDLLINLASLMDDASKFLQIVSLVEHDDLKKSIVRAVNTVSTMFLDNVDRSKCKIFS